VDSNSSRLEQVEDRISEFKDKIKIRKNWRNISQTIQKLWKGHAKTYWLHQKTKPEKIMGIEGEEVQAKGICEYIYIYIYIQ
jgi:hypothetical protein